jgi:succinate dehydrogenase / fumarate reductase iron-sulfur subunit
MIINGKPGQACSSLVDDLQQPIVLEPLTKFPIRRDLMVDRRKMFDNLKKIRGWIEIDGTYNLGIGPKRAGEEQQTAYKLSLCMTCGCCVEACPQVNSGSPFIGPAVISQVRYFNLHPTGKMNAHERLEALMEEDGIAGCGNAQNCVRVCPKCIPLTDSIADVQRQLTIYAIKRLFVK